MAHALDLVGLAVDGDLTGGVLVQTEQRFHHLGAAGAHQARKAQHLALPQLKADVLQAAAAVQVLHRHQRAAGALGGQLLVRRGQRGGLAADHVLNQPGQGVVPRGLGGHDGAVAQNGDGVADLEDLRHAVGDVDHGNAPLLQTVDEGEQMGGLLFGKGRRGLVQNQDFGVDGKRLGDLDHLADANIQIFDTAVDVHIYIKALEQLVSLALHAFFV